MTHARSFMTTQWTPQLDRDGKVSGFIASSRGYDAKPGACVEMSDRTYSVAADGSIRRTDAAHTKSSKKERTRKRRDSVAGRFWKLLSKRERAAIQSAQDLKQREGLGDGETGTCDEEAARRFVGA